jgi:hypothetical protein
MMRIYLCLLLAWATSAGVCAQPLGRLFFAPDERATLDASRGQKHVPKKSAATESVPEVPPAPQIITFDGLVNRSDGRSTAWLNNKPFDEREVRSSLPVNGRIRPDGTLTLQVPRTGASIDLKVGQRAELPSGRVAPGNPTSANVVARPRAEESAK